MGLSGVRGGGGVAAEHRLSRAASEYLSALLDVLAHAIATLRGDAPDHGRADSDKG